MSAALAIARREEPAAAPAEVLPLVKWAGGKTSLLPQIMRHLPGFNGRLFEPFAGSAALTFHLLPKRTLRGTATLSPGAVIADVNADLMDMYRTVRQQTDHVLEALRRLEREHRRNGERCYAKVRTHWNDPMHRMHDGMVLRAAMFLYLNRTCWNGLWRVNRDGKFNVPSARYQNPVICDEPRIRAAAQLLRHVELVTGTFDRTIWTVKAGDLVYFDPPYMPRSETSSFTSYAKDGFGASDHEHLMHTAYELALLRGAHVVVSNSDTPAVRKLYRQYRGGRFHRITRAGTISSKGSGRQPVPELLIVIEGKA